MTVRVLAMRRNRVAGELCPSPLALDARALLELLREAIVAVAGSQKAGAFDLQMDAPQLSRKLSGVGAERFALVELVRAPGILDEFAVRLALACRHDVRRRTARERRAVRQAELHRELLVLMDEDARDRGAA